MIHVERAQIPTSLEMNADTWAEDLCERLRQYYTALEENKRNGIIIKLKKPEALKSRYASPIVKQTLRDMFGKKCCYCEAYVYPSSHPHVEHFRPKSIYPKLAYKWSNLLWACEFCNGTYKNDLFPISPNESQPQPNQDNPSAMDDTDANMLIDPCNKDDNPEDFFEYVFDVEPLDDYFDVILACKNRRAEVSRDTYGLSRPDLIEDLRIHLRNIHNDICLYRNALKDEDFRELQLRRKRLLKAMEPSSEYTAMTRAYICDYHKIDLNYSDQI